MGGGPRQSFFPSAHGAQDGVLSRWASLAVSFWRKSRQPWTVFVDLHHLAPEHFPTPGFEVGKISLPAFAQLCRELM